MSVDSSTLLHVLQLMSKSKIHREWTLADIERLIMPPLVLGQYRVFESEEYGPTGYVSWAFLTTKVAEGYVNRTSKLQPPDWNAGSQLWFIDFIAPYGYVRSMIRMLRPQFIGHTEGFVARSRDKGKVRRYGRTISQASVERWSDHVAPGLH